MVQGAPAAARPADAETRMINGLKVLYRLLWPPA